MGMTITQSIESVEGSQITLSTAVSMMGNAMPPQQQVIDASTLTAEGGVALMQGMGGPQASQAPSDLDIDIRRIEDTTCRVGTLELACTEYEVIAEGMTSRVWHAPQIPPVFVGGVVRAEATISGQSFVSSMTSYTGRLID
jgi:hypothetical protein